LKSRIGELVESFKKSIEKANVSRIVAITNLDPKFQLDIEKGIRAGLDKTSLSYDNLKVICSSTKDLIGFLDDEIKFMKSY
jgi:hypothetical protein